MDLANCITRLELTELLHVEPETTTRWTRQTATDRRADRTLLDLRPPLHQFDSVKQAALNYTGIRFAIKLSIRRMTPAELRAVIGIDVATRTPARRVTSPRRSHESES